MWGQPNPFALPPGLPPAEAGGRTAVAHFWVMLQDFSSLHSGVVEGRAWVGSDTLGPGHPFLEADGPLPQPAPAPQQRHRPARRIRVRLPPLPPPLELPDEL